MEIRHQKSSSLPTDGLLVTHTREMGDVSGDLNQIEFEAGIKCIQNTSVLGKKHQINENNGSSGIVCIGLKKMEFSVPMEL